MADVYTHREVWRIAAPLIISNVSVPLLGMVDTAVVGHLEEPFYLGAVAVGSVIFSFLFLGLNFLRMGTTGLAAQAYGARDNSQIRTVLAQALMTAGAAGILLLLLQTPLRQLGFWLINASSDVTEQATGYFSVRIWGGPATLANYVLLGWFIGMQNARAPLIILLSVNLTNIVLDLLFVVGLGFKAKGVALASVIAESFGVLIGLMLVAKILKFHKGDWIYSHILDTSRFIKLFKINLNLLIRTLTLMFAFAFLTAQGARQGDVILAANAVLLNLQYFMAYALDGFANAAEALVGQAVGARDRRGFTRAIKVSVQWSGIVAVLFCLGYWAGGRQIISLLTNIEAIRLAAFTFLPWLVVSPLVSVWSFLWDGVYVGATKATEMRNTMLFSAFIVYVPAWYLFRDLGNHGLWLAFILFMAARGISMTWLFSKLNRAGRFMPASSS